MRKTYHQTQSFYCPVLKQHAQLRLFCFPYAGGGPSVFREWVEGFPSSLEIQIANLPGREKRFTEDLQYTVNEIVEELYFAIQTYLDRPFAFYGHSMGALIAFELARVLKKDRGVSPTNLFVSGKSAPHLEQETKPIYNLPQEQFFQKLLHLNGTPKYVLENEELMELYEPILRADFQVCDTYQYMPGIHLNCPISVFGGLEDVINEQELKAWDEVTAEPVHVRMLEGDHFFIHTQKDTIQQNIIRDLQIPKYKTLR